MSRRRFRPTDAFVVNSTPVNSAAEIAEPGSPTEGLATGSPSSDAYRRRLKYAGPPATNGNEFFAAERRPRMRRAGSPAIRQATRSTSTDADRRPTKHAAAPRRSATNLWGAPAKYRNRAWHTPRVYLGRVCRANRSAPADDPLVAVAVGWRCLPDGQHLVEPRQRDDDASADADRTHGAVTDGLVGGRAGDAEDLRRSRDGHRRRSVRAKVSEMAEAHRWRGRRHEVVVHVVEGELARQVGHE